MYVPKFDIFRGRSPETDVLWVECVEGLGAAVDRMKTLAARDPGPYFVFQVVGHQVLASIDTSLKAAAGAA